MTRAPLFYSASHLPDRDVLEHAALLLAAPVAEDRATDLNDAEPTSTRSGGGYENAPATALLASHCCLCGRPLLDADSVTAGIGPICRERAGYDAEGPEGALDVARWGAALTAAAGALAPAETKRTEGGPRTAANWLVHQVGRDPKAPLAGRAIVALWALGYHTLARRLCERVGVVVEVTDTTLVVHATFDPEFGRNLRAADAWARWQTSSKRWVAEKHRRTHVWKAIVATYGGRAVLGPNGASYVPTEAERAAAEVAP